LSEALVLPFRSMREQRVFSANYLQLSVQVACGVSLDPPQA